MKIITPDGNSFGHGNSIIDTRNAVLLENTEVCLVDEEVGERRHLCALELEGRVNRSVLRSDVLYLMDADGAAAIATELIAMYARAPREVGEEFLDAFNRRMDAMPRPADDPKGGQPS